MIDSTAGVNVVAKIQTYACDGNRNHIFLPTVWNFKSQLCLAKDDDDDDDHDYDNDDGDVDHENDCDNSNYHNVESG